MALISGQLHSRSRKKEYRILRGYVANLDGVDGRGRWDYMEEAVWHCPGSAIYGLFPNRPNRARRYVSFYVKLAALAAFAAPICFGGRPLLPLGAARKWIPTITHTLGGDERASHRRARPESAAA